MRKFLDNLYNVSGYLSGFFIFLIVSLIVSQVIGRFFGFIVPSVEDFSGYSLAAATFLGLAYTFSQGGHIRVDLAIRLLPPKVRKIQEGIILFLAIILGCFMSFYMVHLSWESYIFEEVSYGYIPVPLWIPQMPVAVGIIMLTIAIMDAFHSLIFGRNPSYKRHEKNEEIDISSGGN